jgi:agmatinase
MVITEQPDPTKVPRFNGISTFARLPTMSTVDRTDVAIVGIPFDAGTTYRPGARFGPEAIRNASRLLRRYNLNQQTYPFSFHQVADYGDISCNPFNIKGATDNIHREASKLFQDTPHAVFLGGDHTLSYPVIKAVVEHRTRTLGENAPKPVLLHFDSHFDTWDEYFGESVTHGTPFRRVVDEGLIDVDHSIHVGIHGSINDYDEINQDQQLGYKTIFMDEFQQHGVDSVVGKIKDRIGSRPIYLSIDVDVVDPAFAPGTGTPEPGGMSSREMLTCLSGLSGLEVISGDVVEVNPSYDHAQITAQLGATLAYEIVSLITKYKSVSI